MLVPTSDSSEATFGWFSLSFLHMSGNHGILSRVIMNSNLWRLAILLFKCCLFCFSRHLCMDDFSCELVSWATAPGSVQISVSWAAISLFSPGISENSGQKEFPGSSLRIFPFHNFHILLMAMIIITLASLASKTRFSTVAPATSLKAVKTKHTAHSSLFSGLRTRVYGLLFTLHSL